MMDMVERVAEAMWQAEWARAGNGGRRRVPWSEIAQTDQDRYRFVARAAIEAMREPTDEMIDAGVDARRALYDRMEAEGLDTKTVLVANHPAGTIYAAMIDAALVPSPPLREE